MIQWFCFFGFGESHPLKNSHVSTIWNHHETGKLCSQFITGHFDNLPHSLGSAFWFPPFLVADVILGIASHHFPNNIPTPLGSPVLPFQTEPLFALPVKVVESNLLVEDLETCDAWMRVQKNIQKTVACQTTWWRASLEGQVRIQHGATIAVEAVSLYAASWYDSKYTRKLELNQRDFLFDDGQLMPM